MSHNELLLNNCKQNSFEYNIGSAVIAKLNNNPIIAFFYKVEKLIDSHVLLVDHDFNTLFTFTFEQNINQIDENTRDNYRFLKFTNDASQLLIINNENFYMYSTITGELISHWSEDTKHHHSHSISYDNSKVISVYQHDVNVWDAVSGTKLYSYNNNSSNELKMIMHTKFSRDNKYIIHSGFKTPLEVHDSSNGELVHTFECYCTDYIDISPDNKYILYVNSLTRPKTFNVWDIENNCLYKSIDVDINFKSRINFTDDGKHFYCQGDKYIGYIKEGIINSRSVLSLINIESGQEVNKYVCPIPSTTYDTEYSSNYEYMVVFDKNNLYYWAL